jgi:16S rRNA G1207 methylase RsmC
VSLSKGLLDADGVRALRPRLSFNCPAAIEEHGGLALVHWRQEALQSVGPTATLRPSTSVVDGLWDEVVVAVQKSRSGTWADLHRAWSLLRTDGRLLVVGPNDLGIKGTVKRLERELARLGEVESVRGRGRAVSFRRNEGAGPRAPQPQAMILPDGISLRTAPGVFSEEKLDRGTAVLLSCLQQLEWAPTRVLDLACGCGPLGLSALTRWPEAQLVAVDADARAIAACRENARTLGCDARCELRWWDAHETIEPGGFDLILANPPWHAGRVVSDEAAQAMLSQLPGLLAPGGRALIVAVTSRPWESLLAAVSKPQVLAEADGFKVLSVEAPPQR